MWKKIGGYILAQMLDPVTIRGLVFAGFGIWGWTEAGPADKVTIITSVGMFIAGLIGILQPPAKRPPKEQTK
jgi:hypothetical protein